MIFLCLFCPFLYFFTSTSFLVSSYPLENSFPVNEEYPSDSSASREDPWILFRQPGLLRVDRVVPDVYDRYEVSALADSNPAKIVHFSVDEPDSSQGSSEKIETTTKIKALVPITTELPVPITQVVFKMVPAAIGSGLAVGGLARGTEPEQAALPEIETTTRSDAEITTSTESPIISEKPPKYSNPVPDVTEAGLTAGVAGVGAGLAASSISSPNIDTTTTTKAPKILEWPYDSEDISKGVPATDVAVSAGTGLAVGGIASAASIPQTGTTTITPIETTTELSTTTATTELSVPTLKPEFENPSEREKVNIGARAELAAGGAGAGAVVGSVSSEPTMTTLSGQMQALQQTMTTNLGFSIFSAVAAIIQVLLLIFMSERRIKKIITVETERIDKNVDKHCGDIKEKLDQRPPPPDAGLAGGEMFDFGPFQGPPEVLPPIESEVVMQESQAEEYQSAPPPEPEPEAVDQDLDSMVEEREQVDQDFLSMAPQVSDEEVEEEPPPRDQGFFSLALQDDSDEEEPPQPPEPSTPPPIDQDFLSMALQTSDDEEPPAPAPPSPKDQDMLSMALQGSDDEPEPEPPKPEPVQQQDQDILAMSLQTEPEEEPAEPPPEPHHSRSPSPRGRGRGHRSRSRSHSPRGHFPGRRGHSPPGKADHAIQHAAPHHGPGPARRSLRGFMPTGAAKHEEHPDHDDSESIHKTHGARPPRPSAEELAKHRIASHLQEL